MTNDRRLLLQRYRSWVESYPHGRGLAIEGAVSRRGCGTSGTTCVVGADMAARGIRGAVAARRRSRGQVTKEQLD